MAIWEATLSAKGQVTIPKDMREALNLRPGDQLVYSLVDGEVVMTAKNIDMKELAGFLGDPPNGPASLEEIDEALLAAGGKNAFETGKDIASDAAA